MGRKYSALLASVEHSTNLSGPSRDLAGLPKNDPECPPEDFILWSGSETNVFNLIRLYIRGWCLALLEMCAQEPDTRTHKKNSWAISTYCVYLHVCWMVPVCVRLSICQCIQLLSWWKISSGKKVQSSEFKFRFHFDYAFCLVKSQRAVGNTGIKKISGEDWQERMNKS